MSARIYALLCLTVLGLLIGGRHVEGRDEGERSRFAGSYTGKFVYKTLNVEDPQEGVFTSSVDRDGNITGEGTNTTADQTAKQTGTIDEDGRVKLVFTFPYSTYTATGTASKRRNGNIIATLIQKQGTKVMGVIELELAPKNSTKK
jgi:hypothetical protein